LIVLLQVRQQVRDGILIGIDKVDGPGGVGEPAAVAARLGAGCPEPVADVIARKARVAQPAYLVELMSRGAADGPVGAGPEGTVDELGEAVARVRRAVGQMLGDDLPAVIVRRGE